MPADFIFRRIIGARTGKIGPHLASTAAMPRTENSGNAGARTRADSVIRDVNQRRIRRADISEISNKTARILASQCICAWMISQSFDTILGLYSDPIIPRSLKWFDSHS